MSTSPRRLAAFTLALVVAALVLAQVASAGGRPTLQDRLDAVVAAGAPGAIALVREGNRTIRLPSGYGNLERRTPMRVRDRFRIGSLTKTFTATVVLQLVGEGTLSLDDTVESRLPGLFPNGAEISIRRLLDMTSGLPDYDLDPRIEAPLLAGDYDHRWDPRELAEIAAEHAPNFAPGERWQYCNTCYVVLGLIVEQATGNPLAAEFQERIFDPLGLRQTSLGHAARIAGPHVHGYFREDGELLDTTPVSPSWGWAAGAIVSTADDVAKFYRALLRGRLLSPELMRTMLTAIPAPVDPGRYGLGIGRVPSPCGRGHLLGHGGNILGYNASAWGNERRQYVIFVNLDAESQSRKLGPAMDRFRDAAVCG